MFSDAAIQCVLTLKVLHQLPLRAAQGMAGSLVRLVGLDWPVPQDSTLSRRQGRLTVAISCRPRGEPLHLIIDRTDLKVPGQGEQKVKRHGADRRWLWRKVHRVVDADRHAIRAVEMTDHRHGDAAVLPSLLAPLPPHERVAVHSAEGAYDPRSTDAARPLGRRRWSGRRSATPNPGRGRPRVPASATIPSAPSNTSDDGSGSS